jgi:hypothetical protein
MSFYLYIDIKYWQPLNHHVGARVGALVVGARVVGTKVGDFVVGGVGALVGASVGAGVGIAAVKISMTINTTTNIVTRPNALSLVPFDAFKLASIVQSKIVKLFTSSVVWVFSVTNCNTHT